MSIKGKVIEILSKGWSFQDTITEETNLFSEMAMDEIDKMELTMMLEEEFGIDITNEDAEKWLRVRDIVEYVTAKKL